MNIFEMLFYGLMPMGQLLMRLIKLNGSLDKLILLFPLFLIPPFSFIPVLFAKFGWIKKGKDKVIDAFVLIPIIFRFILIIFITQVADIGNFMLQVGLVFGALLVTNIIRHYTTRKCSGKVFQTIVKSSFDSMFEYSFGVLTTFLIMFIPFIGQILQLLLKIPVPYISQIVESIIWGLGFAGGYMLINMIDSNFASDQNYCDGKLSKTRMIISGIAMGIALLYQFKNLIV